MKRFICRFALLLFAASSLAAGEHDYVLKMIRCDEKDEQYVSDAYLCHINLLARRVVAKGDLKLPSRLTQKTEEFYVFERAFYVSPNMLRGFILSIPLTLMVEKDGVLENSVPLRLTREDSKQGIVILELGES